MHNNKVLHCIASGHTPTSAKQFVISYGAVHASHCSDVLVKHALHRLKLDLPVATAINIATRSPFELACSVETKFCQQT